MLPPFPHYLVSVTLFDFCLAFPYLFNGNFIASLPTPVGPLYLPNCKLFIPSVQRFPLPKQLNTMCSLLSCPLHSQQPVSCLMPTLLAVAQCNMWNNDFTFLLDSELQYTRVLLQMFSVESLRDENLTWGLFHYSLPRLFADAEVSLIGLLRD